MGTLESRAVSLGRKNFRAPMQPVDRREAQMRAHCGLARLLGGIVIARRTRLWRVGA